MCSYILLWTALQVQALEILLITPALDCCNSLDLLSKSVSESGWGLQCSHHRVRVTADRVSNLVFLGVIYNNIWWAPWCLEILQVEESHHI